MVTVPLHAARQQTCARAAASMRERVYAASDLQHVRERDREYFHLSSHTGLMQVPPGHALAHPRSRASRTQHQTPQEPRRHQ